MVDFKKKNIKKKFSEENVSQTLNELAATIYADNKAKGWHDEKRSPLEFHMLIVSEIAEAAEEVRKGKPDLYGEVENDDGYPATMMSAAEVEELELKPLGEAVEIADALIRILDYLAAERPYVLGSTDFQGSISDWPIEKGFEGSGLSPLDAHAMICQKVLQADFYSAIDLILDYSASRGWDLEKIVELKLAYNRTRSYRHGNKKY